MPQEPFESLPNEYAKAQEKRGLSVSRAGGGSAGDRVSIDRDALRVLCLAAGNLCRKRTDTRVAAVRAALNRLDADWEQYRQNDKVRV